MHRWPNNLIWWLATHDPLAELGQAGLSAWRWLISRRLVDLLACVALLLLTVWTSYWEGKCLFVGCVMIVLSSAPARVGSQAWVAQMVNEALAPAAWRAVQEQWLVDSGQLDFEIALAIMEQIDAQERARRR